MNIKKYAINFLVNRLVKLNKWRFQKELDFIKEVIIHIRFSSTDADCTLQYREQCRNATTLVASVNRDKNLPFHPITKGLNRVFQQYT